ncbi:MAG: hypothetical protein AAFQ27_12840 [Pseudomonadota bacterium]
MISFAAATLTMLAYQRPPPEETGVSRWFTFSCEVVEAQGGTRTFTGSLRRDGYLDRYGNEQFRTRWFEVLDKGETKRDERVFGNGWEFEAVMTLPDEDGGKVLGPIRNYEAYEMDWSGHSAGTGIVIHRSWTELRPAVAHNKKRLAAGLCKFEEKDKAA